MDAFISGSFAYGTPGPESDIDLVIEIDDEGLTTLEEQFVDQLTNTESGDPYPESSSCFRFGKLNLIAVSNPKLYETWKQGTEELIARKPVTRDEAIEVMRKKRIEAGFGC